MQLKNKSHPIWSIYYLSNEICTIHTLSNAGESQLNSDMYNMTHYGISSRAGHIYDSIPGKAWACERTLVKPRKLPLAQEARGNTLSYMSRISCHGISNGMG